MFTNFFTKIRCRWKILVSRWWIRKANKRYVKLLRAEMRAYFAERRAQEASNKKAEA